MVLKEKRTIIFIAAVLIIFLGTRSFMVPQHRQDQGSVYAFPTTMGQWQGNDVSFDRDLLASWLGTNNMVFRRYHDDSRGYAVTVYIAYYQDMGTSDLAHAPEVCYPGQGWKIVSNREIDFVPAGSGINVKRMHIARNMEQEVVYSWWQTRERIIPSNSRYRLYQIINRISGNDIASIWVRVSAESAGPGRTDDLGEEMVNAFCGEALPLLANYFKSRG